MDTLTRLFNHIFGNNIKYSQPEEGSYPYMVRFAERLNKEQKLIEERNNSILEDRKLIVNNFLTINKLK